MGRHKKNGSGVDKDKEKGFSKELGARSCLGREGVLPPTIWVDKRGEATWKWGGNNGNLLGSFFQPRNAQIAADTAVWFPAALWLDLELQAVPSLVPDFAVR